MIPEQYRFFIKLFLTVIILFFIIQLLDYKKLIYALSIAKKELLIFVLLSIPVWIGLKSLKWKILLSSFFPKTSMWLACKSFLGGLGPGLLTPAKIGELTRTFYLPYENNFNILDTTGMNFNPFSRQWKLNNNIYPINYFSTAKLS